MSKKDFTHEDTIAAIATAPGRGGVAIIRISGEDSFSILNRLFKRKIAQNAPNNLEWESHKLYYGQIIDTNSQKMIDIGLAVFMKAPNSFTGQDTVEIHSHGGLLLPKKILDLCIHNGARPARPGEFSLRAFLNGKLDLSQAEAVADIVNAETEEGLRIAGLHLEGELSIRAKEYTDALIDVLAEIEAQVDFPEEDIEPATKQQIIKTTTELKQKIDSLAETFNQGRILKHGINTAIIGKPNVGKSSLLNRLVMKQRAIVSPEPGTTRDFIEESISVDGIVLNLVDTAGIRAAKDSIEKIGVDLSHKKASEAELIIGVFDSSKELDSDDLKVLASMKDKNAIAVCNKIDLTKRLESDSFKGYVSPDLVVSTSAKNGQGIEELKEKIVNTALGRDDRSEGSEFLITELRHKNALERASQYIEKFLEAFALGNSPEFLAIDLHSALESISEITGEISSEAILDRVFSKFCIGK